MSDEKYWTSQKRTWELTLLYFKRNDFWLVSTKLTIDNLTICKIEMTKLMIDKDDDLQNRQLTKSSIDKVAD